VLKTGEVFYTPILCICFFITADVCKVHKIALLLCWTQPTQLLKYFKTQNVSKFCPLPIFHANY